MADKIDDLLAQRGQVYGDMVKTHEAIAKIWSGIIGHDISAHQVALMMVGLKLRRSAVSPNHPDNYDDGHGYIKIAETCHEAGHSWPLT